MSYYHWHLKKKKKFGKFLPLGDNKRGAATDIKDFFGRNDPNRKNIVGLQTFSTFLFDL
jgi:hypothetical protein